MSYHSKENLNLRKSTTCLDRREDNVNENDQGGQEGMSIKNPTQLQKKLGELRKSSEVHHE